MALSFSFVIALGLGFLVTVSSCPSNLPPHSYPVHFNSYCYNFVSTGADYEDAEKVCQRANGHLASIQSEKENDMISWVLEYKLNYTREVWIGINDIQIENNFQWTDGSPVVYGNWEDGYGPRKGITHWFRDCGALYVFSREWHDHRCSSGIVEWFNEKRPYVCKYKLPPTTAEPQTTEVPDTDAEPQTTEVPDTDAEPQTTEAPDTDAEPQTTEVPDTDAASQTTGAP